MSVVAVNADCAEVHISFPKNDNIHYFHTRLENL